jgi:putative glutamine amidotransferase
MVLKSVGNPGHPDNTPVRIGVAAVFELASWSFWNDRAALVPASYHQAVVAAGGLDIPLVPDRRVTADPDLLLDVIDGLMLIGGVDVDPTRYGAEPAAALESTSVERDDFEIALTRRAIERQMPVLGICRGMQILNIALKGSLTQDLGKELNSVHRPQLGTFEGTEHEIEVSDQSLAATVCGAGLQVIHSHHHQAVEALGAGLLVSAASEDGVIEAVELEGHPFALGVQWHPEADEKSRVIASLVRAAESRSDHSSDQRLVAK